MGRPTKIKIVVSVACLAIVFLCGCVSGYISWAEAQTRRPEHRISNGVLHVGICNRDGGAVCSIVYDGHEFVNDHDHGRQMQIAWFVNGDLTGINPTEAGSADDSTGQISTSILLSARVDGHTITTESHPAYWFRPGKGHNTRAITRDTLKKMITLGHSGDPHVIVVDATIVLSKELTAPPTEKIRVEMPAFYASWKLAEAYQLDLRSGKMEILPPASITKICNMNARMGLNTDRYLIPILSSSDGRYAVAEYTPQAEGFWTYSSYNIPCPSNMEFACNKLTTRFEHAAEAGHTYSYRTFVIIGDLTTVRSSAMKLRWN